MKEKTSEQWREWEEEAKEFIKTNYPSNRAWVRKNLEVLNNQQERKSPKLDNEIVADAIQITEDFARRIGINLRPKDETDVLHIPSRLEAIKRFEIDTAPLYKQLSLDRTVRIFILAEATSVHKSINYASTGVAEDHLDKLTKLVQIHKDLTRS